MNISITIITFIAIVTVVFLSACVIYLTFVYRRLLDKYSDLVIHADKAEIGKKIKLDINKFVDNKMDKTISKVTDQAVDLISQSAKQIAKTMREETIEKLAEEKKGEEEALASEYDEAKAEAEKFFENFKASEVERIRKSANEILSKIMPEISKKVIDQEKLVLEELENAKRSNLF